MVPQSLQGNRSLASATCRHVSVLIIHHLWSWENGPKAIDIRNSGRRRYCGSVCAIGKRRIRYHLRSVGWIPMRRLWGRKESAIHKLIPLPYIALCLNAHIVDVLVSGSNRPNQQCDSWAILSLKTQQDDSRFSTTLAITYQNVLADINQLNITTEEIVRELLLPRLDIVNPEADSNITLGCRWKLPPLSRCTISSRRRR